MGAPHDKQHDLDLHRATQTLAASIAEAVDCDEQGEGCDISAGLFGIAFSKVVRDIAQQQLDCAKYKVLLHEFDAYNNHDKDYMDSPFQQRVNDALSDV